MCLLTYLACGLFSQPLSVQSTKRVIDFNIERMHLGGVTTLLSRWNSGFMRAHDCVCVCARVCVLGMRWGRTIYMSIATEGSVMPTTRPYCTGAAAVVQWSRHMAYSGRSEIDPRQ